MSTVFDWMARSLPRAARGRLYDLILDVLVRPAGFGRGRPTDHISSGAHGARQARSPAPGKPVVPSHPLYPPLAANSGRFRRGEVFLRAVVKRTVVGSAGALAAPDNPQQGSSKNPDCVLVILAAGTGASGKYLRPRGFRADCWRR